MVSAVYVDQGPSISGTALAANTLNSAVVAQGYLISGGVLSVGATGSLTVSGLGVDILLPQTEAVVARGDLTGYVLVAPETQALTLSADNYVDLVLESTGTGGFYHGTYSITAVSIGASAPAQVSGRLRLYRATVSNSGHVTAVAQLATPLPVASSMVSADFAEAQTNDVLSYAASVVHNLDRIRYQLGVLIGGAWNAAVQMIPLSQKGAANGVAELDAGARLPNAELPTDVSLVGNLAVGGHVGQGIASGYALSVGGSEYLNGNLTLIGSQTIGGYLAMGVAHTSGFTLDVGGGTVLHGDTYVNTALYAQTGLYGNSGTNILNLTGTAGINMFGPIGTSSTMTVGSNVTINGNLNVATSGAVTSFNGPLTVVGLSDLRGGLQVEGTATLTGSLNVSTSGALADFNGPMNVTGLASLNGGMTVGTHGANSASGWCQLNGSAHVNAANLPMEPLAAGTPAFTGLASFVSDPLAGNTLGFPVFSLPGSLSGDPSTTALPGTASHPYAYIKVWVNDRAGYIPYFLSP